MSESGRRVPPALPAATLLLVRDGASGLEVFMAERHRGSAFARGALVFPGGRAEPADAEPRLHARCAGTGGLSRDEVTLRLAGIRETFEECGVLLARPRGAAGLIETARQAALAARGEVQAGTLPLAELVAREDLELACDLLVPFAHWITPEFMPKRYDTRFFLVEAPPDQIAAHDGTELVDSVWIQPAAAREEARTGKRTIIFPTLMNLGKLARSRSVGAALELARREPVVPVLPRLERRGAQRVVCIPEAAGYGVTEAPVESLLGPGGASPGAPPRSA